jgi:uncharacterized Ntn-hydrolase superfamily protein
MKLNTFSIAARCQRTGELGVAVSTKVPAVGSLCAFVHAGVGAVATQAWVNPMLGPRVLDALATGLAAEVALREVLDTETDREIRQLGVVDSRGGSGGFTEADTDPWKGALHWSRLRRSGQHARRRGNDCRDGRGVREEP